MARNYSKGQKIIIVFLGFLCFLAISSLSYHLIFGGDPFTDALEKIKGLFSSSSAST